MSGRCGGRAPSGRSKNVESKIDLDSAVRKQTIISSGATPRPEQDHAVVPDEGKKSVNSSATTSWAQKLFSDKETKTKAPVTVANVTGGGTVGSNNSSYFGDFTTTKMPAYARGIVETKKNGPPLFPGKLLPTGGATSGKTDSSTR